MTASQNLTDSKMAVAQIVTDIESFQNTLAIDRQQLNKSAAGGASSVQLDKDIATIQAIHDHWVTIRDTKAEDYQLS